MRERNTLHLVNSRRIMVMIVVWIRLPRVILIARVAVIRYVSPWFLSYGWRIGCLICVDVCYHLFLVGRRSHRARWLCFCGTESLPGHQFAFVIFIAQTWVGLVIWDSRLFHLLRFAFSVSWHLLRMTVCRWICVWSSLISRVIWMLRLHMIFEFGTLESRHRFGAYRTDLDSNITQNRREKVNGSVTWKVQHNHHPLFIYLNLTTININTLTPFLETRQDNIIIYYLLAMITTGHTSNLMRTLEDDYPYPISIGPL